MSRNDDRHDRDRLDRHDRHDRDGALKSRYRESSHSDDPDDSDDPGRSRSRSRSRSGRRGKSQEQRHKRHKKHGSRERRRRRDEDADRHGEQSHDERSHRSGRSHRTHRTSRSSRSHRSHNESHDDHEDHESRSRSPDSRKSDGMEQRSSTTMKRRRYGHAEEERRRSRSESRDRRRERREGRGYRSRSRRRGSPVESSRRARPRSRHRDNGEIMSLKSQDELQLSTAPLRAKGPLPDQRLAFSRSDKAADGQMEGGNGASSAEDKQKPNLAPSGLLAAAANTVKDDATSKSVVLKYHEPNDAKAPSSTTAPWQCFVFKGSNQEPLDTIELYRRSCWLIGRESSVVDYLVEHPSCSKQHAVLQFRYTEKPVPGGFGEKKGKVRLYLIDLESANGTRLNGEPLSQGRYVEIRAGDVLKFGESEREYVIILPKTVNKQA